MFYSLTSALVFLFLPMAHAQYNQWNPFSPYFNPIPPNAFQGGVFDPNWGANLANQIQQFTSNVISKAMSSGNAISIVMMDGVTTVTATIGGRPYTARFPYGASISTFTMNYIDRQGQLVEEFTIKVDGKSYTYKTVGGRTTGPPGGGPFQVN
ncbi:hypothetical protein GCK32_004026 [Trichostrongylus colubriformis]|uniref:Uncharacterized protein n=1 Tax=Trichostrongylus colubriformis TaxID=6319 RepID=A0AAN8FEQ7_TRICO